MNTTSEIPLLLKQPMQPLHAHILAGYPLDWYPGDDKYPETMVQIAAWEAAMAAEQSCTGHSTRLSTPSLESDTSNSTPS